jgi:hypothetical protein
MLKWAGWQTQVMMSQYGRIEVIRWCEHGLVSFSGTLLGWKFHYIADFLSGKTNHTCHRWCTDCSMADFKMHLVFLQCKENMVVWYRALGPYLGISILQYALGGANSCRSSQYPCVLAGLIRTLQRQCRCTGQHCSRLQTWRRSHGRTMRIRKWDNFTTGSTDSTWGSGCSRPWSLPRTW